jgi:hypothetical protein
MSYCIHYFSGNIHRTSIVGGSKKVMQGDEYQNFLGNKKFFIPLVFLHLLQDWIIAILLTSYLKENLLAIHSDCTKTMLLLPGGHLFFRAFFP